MLACSEVQQRLCDGTMHSHCKLIDPVLTESCHTSGSDSGSSGRLVVVVLSVVVSDSGGAGGGGQCACVLVVVV